MKYKKFLSLTALAGALALGNVAHAEHPDDRGPRSRTTYRDDGYRGDAQLIGTARLRDRRGEVAFQLTPGQRRDGLMLWTDARDLRLLQVELEYSDGLVETLRGRELRTALLDDGTAVIQLGRPPGLRVVRVHYTMRGYERRARLQLLQFGDGYTSEADLRHDRSGVYIWRERDFGDRRFDRVRRDRDRRYDERYYDDRYDDDDDAYYDDRYDDRGGRRRSY